MVMRSFQIGQNAWDSFKREVGDRNASATLRNFIESYSGDQDVDEMQLMFDYGKIKDEYENTKLKYEHLHAKYKKIQEMKEQDRLKEEKAAADLKKKLQDIKYETAKSELHRIVDN